MATTSGAPKATNSTAAASARGADVTLVSTVERDAHPGVEVIRVGSAAEMQAVALPDLEIFLAMPRRGVHGARARIDGHVIAQDHRHLSLEEGVLQALPFEVGTSAASEHGDLAETVARRCGP